MAKINGSWSGVKKLLETELLAENLRGRVKYRCAAFPNMDGCRVFTVFLDEKPVKRFSWETVQTWFHDTGIVPPKDTKFDSVGEYWDGFWDALGRTPMSGRTEYTDGEFCAALEAYRQSPVEESLASGDPIRLMFAILDRRTGKRRLTKLDAQRNALPRWVLPFLDARLGAGTDEAGLPSE